MDRAHEVQGITIVGTVLRLTVDGRKYRIDLAKVSERLAKATPAQRRNFQLSPAGYGIHWSDIDEDLSIDGLIRLVHPPALAAAKT